MTLIGYNTYIWDWSSNEKILEKIEIILTTFVVIIRIEILLREQNFKWDKKKSPAIFSEVKNDTEAIQRVR